jgi:NTP pyrophosphatase (non-canonical NTP hydrolase)
MEKEKTALEIVAIELGKAKGKHPEFPYLYSERLAIIAEEFGELAAAINDEERIERIAEEAAHIAVTAIRFIEGCLNDGE